MSLCRRSSVNKKHIYPHHIKKTKLLLHYKQIKNIKIFTKNIRFLNIANIK